MKKLFVVSKEFYYSEVDQVDHDCDVVAVFTSSELAFEYCKRCNSECDSILNYFFESFDLLSEL